MDHPQAKETICNYCNEVFTSKGKYQYHFRRVHQSEVRIHSSNQEETSIYRSENEKFTCICGKGYDSGQSLRRHQKICRQWKHHEVNVEASSDSEISVQGNKYKYLIFRIDFRNSTTRIRCHYSWQDARVRTRVTSFATCIGFFL